MAAVAAALAVVTAGCMPALVPAAGAAELETYGACDALLDRLHQVGREHAGTYDDGGYPAAGEDLGDAVPIPAPAAPSAMPRPAVDPAAPEATTAPEATASGTNVQEAGVDEDDVVEAGPGRLLVLADSVLRYVDVSTGTPVLRGSARFDFGAVSLLAEGDRVLVVGTDTARSTATVVVAEVSVADPDALAVGATVRIEGTLTAARARDGVARVVVASQPAIGPFSQNRYFDERIRAGDTGGSEIDASTLQDWLPDVDGAPAPACDRVLVPRDFAGMGMLTIMSLDMTGPLQVLDQTSLLTGGESVYASETTLYVSTPSAQSTTLHAFDVTGRAAATYLASGDVAGRVEDRWSMSESGGVLRVVTTDLASPVGVTTTSLVTLRRDGDRLVQAGRVGGIGRDEQVKAVRFVGDTGYVVTFKRTDPLWVLDLRDPEHPEVAGELHVPGFSNYLHPVDDKTLVGVGQDADPTTGRPLGFKVSTYDVSDPAHPAETSTWSAGPGTTSPAEEDPHAFLWWAPTGTVAVPLAATRSPLPPRSPDLGPTTGTVPPTSTAAPAGLDTVVLQLGSGSLAATGRLTCPARPYQGGTQRSAVVGGHLFTVCDGGASSFRLGSLAPAGTVTWG